MLILLSGLFSLPITAHCQINQGTSSDPNNPVNWKIVRSVQGACTSASYWENNGGQRFEQDTSKTFTGLELIEAYTNVTDRTDQFGITAACHGTYTFNITWKGEGTSPDIVLVELNSFVSGMHNPTLDCGLTLLDILNDQEYGEINRGKAFRSLKVTKGKAQTVVTGSANSFTTYVPQQQAPRRGGTSVTFSANAEIVPKALAIQKMGGDTYKRGMNPNNLSIVRELNQRRDLKHGEGDVGVPITYIQDSNLLLEGRVGVGYKGLLFGRWSPVQNLSSNWQGQLPQWQTGPGIETSGNYSFDLFAMHNMRLNGGTSKSIALTVTDPTDAEQQDADYELRLHCEAGQVRKGQMPPERSYIGYVTRSNGELIQSGPGGAGITDASYTESQRTITLTWSLSRQVGAELTKFFNLSLGLENGVEYGIASTSGQQWGNDMPGPDIGWPIDIYTLALVEYRYFYLHSIAEFGPEEYNFDYPLEADKQRIRVRAWVNSNNQVMGGQ